MSKSSTIYKVYTYSLLRQSSKITRSVDHIGRDDRTRVFSINVLILSNAAHDKQCPNTTVDTKFNIGVEVVTDHDGSGGVDMMAATTLNERLKYVRCEIDYTYCAITASIMVLLGLPMTMGVCLAAYTMGADIDPAANN